MTAAHKVRDVFGVKTQIHTTTQIQPYILLHTPSVALRKIFTAKIVLTLGDEVCYYRLRT